MDIHSYNTDSVSVAKHFAMHYSFKKKKNKVEREELRMSAIIINFQSPVEREDLIDRYKRDQLTNIDHILNFESTLKEWTVDKNSKVGDAVFFMCAKTSKEHMGHVCAEVKRCDDPSEIIDFAEAKRELYKKYAGNIVAVGVIEEDPFQTEDSGYACQHWRNPWYAKIGKFQLLSTPIHISEYCDYITVSRTGSITRLTNEQEDTLKKQIQEKNPQIDIRRYMSFEKVVRYLPYIHSAIQVPISLCEYYISRSKSDFLHSESR